MLPPRIARTLEQLLKTPILRDPLTRTGIVVAVVPILSAGLGTGLSFVLLCTENARIARTVCGLGGTSGGALVETLLYPIWLLPALLPFGLLLTVIGWRRSRQAAANTTAANPDATNAASPENIFIPKSLRKRR